MFLYFFNLKQIICTPQLCNEKNIGNHARLRENNHLFYCRAQKTKICDFPYPIYDLTKHLNKRGKFLKKLWSCAGGSITR